MTVKYLVTKRLHRCPVIVAGKLFHPENPGVRIEPVDAFAIYPENDLHGLDRVVSARFEKVFDNLDDAKIAWSKLIREWVRSQQKIMDDLLTTAEQVEQEVKGDT